MRPVATVALKSWPRQSVGLAMIDRAPLPAVFEERDVARDAVRAWVRRIEEAQRAREPLAGLMHEYARRMGALRAAEERMPRLRWA